MWPSRYTTRRNPRRRKTTPASHARGPCSQYTTSGSSRDTGIPSGRPGSFQKGMCSAPGTCPRENSARDRTSRTVGAVPAEIRVSKSDAIICRSALPIIARIVRLGDRVRRVSKMRELLQGALRARLFGSSDSWSAPAVAALPLPRPLDELAGRAIDQRHVGPDLGAESRERIVGPMPSTCERSTPVSRCSEVRRSKRGSFSRGF